MNKEEFKEGLLQLLKKSGYSIEGITNLNIICDVDNLPEINISYFKL